MVLEQQETFYAQAPPRNTVSTIGVVVMKIIQQRICFLEAIGEEYLMELVAEGAYLDDIVRRIDPMGKVGVTKNLLTRWLSGKVRREVEWEFDVPGIGGATERRAPETIDESRERGLRYDEARQAWALATVENAGKRLMEETDEKQATLRKVQAEFALRLAGVWDKRFAQQSGTQVAVQVNMQSGEDHMNALRRREMPSLATRHREAAFPEPDTGPHVETIVASPSFADPEE